MVMASSVMGMIPWRLSLNSKRSNRAKVEDDSLSIRVAAKIRSSRARLTADGGCPHISVLIVKFFTALLFYL
jgi:hypothetical protein